jgi:uncharacterized protein
VRYYRWTSIPTERAVQLTRLLVPTFTQMLQGFSHWLDKATAGSGSPGPEVDLLMSLRLAPDMFPLSAQVRFACFQAQEPMYRLRGLPVPDTLVAMREEGVRSNEQQGTFAQAQAHIAQTIALLAALSADALDASATRQIALDLPNGVVFDMTGEEYARDWCLPQFYFHIATGYAILRHHGVPLGKPDYVSHMFPFIRPGTLPTH